MPDKHPQKNLVRYRTVRKAKTLSNHLCNSWGGVSVCRDPSCPGLPQVPRAFYWGNGAPLHCLIMHSASSFGSGRPHVGTTVRNTVWRLSVRAAGNRLLAPREIIASRNFIRFDKQRKRSSSECLPAIDRSCWRNS